MWEESAIRSIAAMQHGLVSRDQLQLVGITDNDVSRRVQDARLERIYAGVYYVDSIQPTWRGRVLAAVMAAGPDAVASHRTAGVLWELDAVYGHVIEITVPVEEAPEPDGVILHRTRRSAESVMLHRIPVSPIERTLLDLAAIIPLRTLIKAVRSAVRKSLTTVEGLDVAVKTHGGRGVTGTRKMRTAVRYVDDDQSGSVAEIDLKEIVLGSHIPRPIQQLEITLPDRSHAYPDFSWPDRMRIVEADGFEAHGTPEALRVDLIRQNALMDLGWEIRRFSATEIREHPDEVRAEIIRFVNKPFL